MELYQSAIVLAAISFFSCSGNSNQSTSSDYQKSYQEIHEEAIVIDGHNDFLYFLIDEKVGKYTENQTFDYSKDLSGITHIDLERQKEGGLDVQIFSVWCPGTEPEPYDRAIQLIDSMTSIVERNELQMTLVERSDQIHSALSKGISVAMMGVEGGHMIEDDLSKLDEFYDRGVRYMTLTWNNSTSWATSSYDEQPQVNLDREKGLNDFGRQVVKRMNELGMIVDISHVGEQTFWDVMDVTTKPVIASHSSAYNICKWHRNLKDDQLKAIAANEGVAMVNFYPGYIDSVFWENERKFFERHKTESDSLMEVYDDEWIVEYHLYRKYKEDADAIRPSLSKLIDHIEYIVDLVGVDYVGIGSDFDGITINPKQLDDVSDFPQITKALLERGYSEQEVKKVLGGNFMRVLRANGG